MKDSQAMYGDLALADLDGDGDLDALVASGFRSEGSFPTRLLWNDGGAQGGTLGQFTDSGQELNETMAARFAVGDLDRDGSFDLLVSNGDHRYGEAWLNDGAGRLVDSGLRLESPSQHMATWPSLGDLDGDGNVLAVGATNHLHVTPYSGDALFMKLTLDGDVLWERTWSGVGYEQAWSVALAEDGGYHVFGETDSCGFVGPG